jgi:hypothetical protein
MIGARIVRMSKDVIRIRVAAVIGGRNGDRAFYRPQHCGLRNNDYRHRAYVLGPGSGNNASHAG